MDIGQVVMKLSHLGYRFELQGERVRYKWQGQGDPDPAQVRPLLALVKKYKPQVISYLAQRPQATERVLTCYECGHFLPAVISPNPTQAWGHCRRLDRGRFGVAMACEVIMKGG